MNLVPFIKSIPKRVLTSLYNTALRIQNFHHTNPLTLVSAKQALFKYSSLLQTHYKTTSLKLKLILQQKVSQYPNILFLFYILFWITFHYLVYKITSFQIKRNEGKGIFEAVSYRIAEKNKPFVLKLLRDRLFNNQKVRTEIEAIFREIPNNARIHSSIEAALSQLIISEFIKVHASSLSVQGFQVLVVDKMTEKQLTKLVITLLNNSYIRKQLKELILDYLGGEAFGELVVDQLAGLVEMSYTKKMLSDLVQDTFASVVKDPQTRYLAIEYIKDWLV